MDWLKPFKYIIYCLYRVWCKTHKNAELLIDRTTGTYNYRLNLKGYH
jgi:hypothetical protein